MNKSSVDYFNESIVKAPPYMLKEVRGCKFLQTDYGAVLLFNNKQYDESERVLFVNICIYPFNDREQFWPGSVYFVTDKVVEEMDLLGLDFCYSLSDCEMSTTFMEVLSELGEELDPFDAGFYLEGVGLKLNLVSSGLEDFIVKLKSL